MFPLSLLKQHLEATSQNLSRTNFESSSWIQKWKQKHVCEKHSGLEICTVQLLIKLKMADELDVQVKIDKKLLTQLVTEFQIEKMTIPKAQAKA